MNNVILCFYNAESERDAGNANSIEKNAMENVIVKITMKSQKTATAQLTNVLLTR